MIDELIKAANEYRYRHDITYSEGVILPLASIMADFAAECVRAERERADRLNAALVEINQRYIANPHACSACYDLAIVIAKLNKDLRNSDKCKHLNKELLKSYCGAITVCRDYKCPDCGKEWTEDNGY